MLIVSNSIPFIEDKPVVLCGATLELEISCRKSVFNSIKEDISKLEYSDDVRPTVEFAEGENLMLISYQKGLTRVKVKVQSIEGGDNKC